MDCGGCQDEEKLISISIETYFLWSNVIGQYMAGAGAIAKIRDKGGAGSVTLLDLHNLAGCRDSNLRRCDLIEQHPLTYMETFLALRQR